MPCRARHRRASDMKTVLIAEDDCVNREIAMRAVTRLGYRAIVAESGAEAAAFAADNAPDLILMDYHMPGLDGVATLRLVRDRESTRGAARPVPIVAMTADGSAGARERLLAAGFDDYLAKPFRLDALRALLARWLADDGGPAPGSPVAAAAAGDDVMRSVGNAIEGIRALQPGDAQFLRKLIALYLDNGNRTLQELQAAAQRGDGAEMARLTHMFKSSSRNMGAVAVAERCETIETAIRRDATLPAARMREMLLGIEPEFDRVAAVLRTYLQ